MMKRLILPLAAALAAAGAAGMARAETATADLTFEVGPRQGSVRVALYDSKQAGSAAARAGRPWPWARRVTVASPA